VAYILQRRLSILCHKRIARLYLIASGKLATLQFYPRNP
jgi:hypothetical protein